MKAQEIKQIADKISKWSEDQELDINIVKIAEYASSIWISVHTKRTISQYDLEKLSNNCRVINYYIFIVNGNIQIDLAVDITNKEIPY